MRDSFLSILRCADCSKADWNLKVISKDEREIRDAELRCACGSIYNVETGVLDMIRSLPAEVEKERKYLESFDYIKDSNGKGYKINSEAFQKFEHLFLSLPLGDGSHFFKPGGSFSNQAGNSQRFFKTFNKLNLSGKERVLEVGANFGWASRYFSKAGCEVAALDITDYLKAGDLYFDHDNCYFERIKADMNNLPFCDNSFDIIFSHSVIHHCKDIAALFAEFHRVLRPQGRIVALHECALGIFEDRSAEPPSIEIMMGANENSYTLAQWRRAAVKGGFKKVKFHFFSIVDDYIHRKSLRGAKQTFKLKLAQCIQAVKPFNYLLNQLSIAYRIFFRPKAWMMVMEKK